jgi:CheY-like chemotaxis protein
LLRGQQANIYLENILTCTAFRWLLRTAARAGIARTEHQTDLNGYQPARLDGLEVIRRIRSMEGYADLPIAVITALSDDNERVRRRLRPLFGQADRSGQTRPYVDQYFAKQ